MRTYQKQYGGRFVLHLVYHRVEESWYRELSQTPGLRSVPKLFFWGQDWDSHSLSFRFEAAIWRGESGISSRYPEITLSSLIYSLILIRGRDNYKFRLVRGLNRLTCDQSDQMRL